MGLIHFAVPQKQKQHCKATILQFKKKRNSRLSGFLFYTYSHRHLKPIITTEMLIRSLFVPLLPTSFAVV